VPKGVCRIKDGWEDEDSVWVEYHDDGQRQEISATRYVKRATPHPGTGCYHAR
jgi:hypothetical protein